MAQSFIGKTISLISHSDIRYRGTLAGVDPAQSTIQLSNVYSMGTETRRPADQFIPPNADPYHYIVFRASEVKDLAVDYEPVPPAPQRNLPDDPAILSSGAPPAPNTNTNANPYLAYNNQSAAPAAPATANGAIDGSAGGSANRRNAVNTADASLVTVERAIGDLRGGRGGGRRGGRGGHYGGGGQTEVTIPTTEFDFQSSNARFNKASLTPAAVSRTPSNGDADDNATNPSDDEEKAYNPTRSFFDTLSSSAHGANEQGPGGGHRGRGGRGRGYGRSRREEEREKNVATFGEPGGLGLMGPGAYVSGYGRRGGGRGRRGGGPPPGQR